MATTVNWAIRARSDLQEIYDYISGDSPQNAHKVTTEIANRTRMLEEHPYSGKVVSEFKKDTIRELIQGKYRIESEDEILISRIWHSARILNEL